MSKYYQIKWTGEGIKMVSNKLRGEKVRNTCSFYILLHSYILPVLLCWCPPCTCLSQYEQRQIHLLIIYFYKVVKPQQSLWASWFQNGLGMGLHGESGFCLKYDSILLSFRSHWKRMDIGNSSLVTEFILVGLTKHPEIQIPLFFLFLEICIITVAGNLGLVTLIRLTFHLHNPI